MDTNSLLLILQSGSLAVCLTLFLALVLSYFNKPDTPRVYERVRWALAGAMLLLAFHYWLQMHYKFRLQGDDVGAAINILFYSPATYIFSYSILRIGCGPRYYSKPLMAAIISVVLIAGTFCYGYLHYDSLHLRGALHTMALLYFLTLLFFIIYPHKEISRVRKRLDEESGKEPVQFDLFLRTSALVLNFASLLTPFCIFYTKALVLVGPLFMITLVFYVVCFIALGFNYGQINSIIEETLAETNATEPVETGDAAKPLLSNEQRAKIGLLLEEWRKSQGYAASELNSTTLAIRLNLPKRHLVQYLREVEGKTFRIWLSDLRLAEAKRLITEHPEYANEAIAEECGFSRSHLQTKFKEATGMTINEWREANVQKR